MTARAKPPEGRVRPPKGPRETRFPDKEADGIACRFLRTYGVGVPHQMEEARFVLAGILVLYKARPSPRKGRKGGGR